MKLGTDVVVVATKNKGKVREFSHAFGKLGITVQSMFDFTGLPEIVEDGPTFAANALIKARIVGETLRIPVLADDSGLCVDALDGAPGVYSARYAGEGAEDAANNAKLLKELAGASVDQHAITGDLPSDVKLLSSAQFVCALALYNPADGTALHAEGAVSGFIIDRMFGEGGFGYDPLFWVPALRRTMAELSTEEKQRISHRGEALSRLMNQLSS
ncbi:XTP/dITP diphosphatase [Paenibacillus abyssi]|uniref:dITP/XTP pyrophosphatase n=1 Tax=Paenibacillus abyssi TaxID=1340531 RepID=A0A917G359_9BACL|nr:XTP/dITP diphosphatase [Paenibacillus abyssi]GGG20682.1 hypothetical protein GCM10010916_41750 [Paenibacillus abyssi]